MPNYGQTIFYIGIHQLVLNGIHGKRGVIVPQTCSQLFTDITKSTEKNYLHNVIHVISKEHISKG